MDEEVTKKQNSDNAVSHGGSENGEKEETTIKSKDGNVSLWYKSWKPKGKPKALVTFVHPLGDYSLRHWEVFQALADAGIQVNAFDFRGHGKSTSHKEPTFNILLDDLSSALSAQESQGVPHFLYGFSNGCTLAFHHLLNNSETKFAGLVMVSPIIERQKKSFLTKIQGYVVPHSHTSTGLKGKRLSRELEKRNSFNEDKLVHKEAQAGLVIKIASKSLKMLKLAPGFKLPVLIVRGDGDAIAEPATTQKFFEQLGNKDKVLHSIPKLFHDIHHEPEHAEASKFIAEWILNHLIEKESSRGSVEKVEKEQSRNSVEKKDSSEKQEVEKEVTPDSKKESESQNIATPGANRVKRTVADFEFIRVLGQGAFGEVKLAREIKTGEEFAIKVLDKKQMSTEESKKKVFTERNVFNTLNHPNIVKLTYTFQDPKFLYFVLELCPNGDLLQQLKKVGKFNKEVTKFYCAEIINGLEHMHSKGVLHRDLKPDNVLLDPQMHAKLTDFGTGAILESGVERTRSTSFVGTEEYVSPELLDEEDPHAVASSDLWALACMIFQFLSGKPPFKGATTYQTFQLIRQREFAYPDDFPEDAKDLIERMLNLDPSKRLGAGPGGYEELKKHPFFKGIDFTTVHQISPPVIKSEEIKEPEIQKENKKEKKEKKKEKKEKKKDKKEG